MPSFITLPYYLLKKLVGGRGFFVPHGKSVVLEPMGNRVKVSSKHWLVCEPGFKSNNTPFMYFWLCEMQTVPSMATAILKRFSHLVKESISYADAVDLWQERIKTHFTNNQFRNKEDIPEILERRRSNKKVNYQMKMKQGLLEKCAVRV